MERPRARRQAGFSPRRTWGSTTGAGRGRFLLPPRSGISGARCASLAFAGSPLPQPGGYRAGQAAIQLAGHHHYLAPMMRLMGDEVVQDMPDVEGQVAPHVG